MKSNKLISAILTASLMSVLLIGCSNNVNNIKNPDVPVETPDEQNEKEVPQEPEYGVTINENSVIFTDSRDVAVTITKNPKRVIVLQNSLLEIWDQAGGTVVGRVEESEDKKVENASSAEVVGSLGSPSLEKILSLQPDLVIALSNYSGHRDIIPALEQSNIEVAAFDNDLLEDYYRTVRIFTAITGRDDLYESHIENVKKSVDAIIEKAPKDKNYKVVILFATAKGITVRDSNTMVGEMLKDLNTVNISDNSGTADTKTFSMEKIIQEDPDFIFVQTMGTDLGKIEERLKNDAVSNPAWASLTAVKEDRYIVLPKDLYIFKPNHRYAEAYEGLAKVLYPEVFK